MSIDPNKVAGFLDSVSGPVTSYMANFGGDISHIRDKEIQRIDQAFNAEEAQKNRDWQTEMSNTAYQRGVEDMKKAGLNPALAYSQGGASTPTASTASSHHSSRGYRGTGDSFFRLIGTALSSAFSMANNVLKLDSKENIAEKFIEAKNLQSLYKTQSAFDLYKNQKGKRHSFSQHSDIDLDDLYTDLENLKI